MEKDKEGGRLSDLPQHVKKRSLYEDQNDWERGDGEVCRRSAKEW